MWVIITHHVTHDLRTLAVWAPGNETTFLTGKENAPVNWLQSVTHIGQCTANDYAHGVIEVARLHLVDDIDAFKFAQWLRRGQSFGFVAQSGSVLLS